MPHPGAGAVRPKVTIPRVDSRDDMIRSLERKLRVQESKTRYLKRAYYQYRRDVRSDTTPVRKLVEQMQDMLAEEEVDTDVISRMLKDLLSVSREVLKLDQCPFTGQPLSDNTFVNPCGHIFERRALLDLEKNKTHYCPKCSVTIMIPREGMYNDRSQMHSDSM